MVDALRESVVNGGRVDGARHRDEGVKGDDGSPFDLAARDVRRRARRLFLLAWTAFIAPMTGLTVIGVYSSPPLLLGRRRWFSSQ